MTAEADARSGGTPEAQAQSGGTPEAGWMRTATEGDGLRLTAGGLWTLRHAAPLSRRLEILRPAGPGPVRLDVSAVERLDTAGAYLLARLADRLTDEGHPVELVGLRAEHADLFEAVRRVGCAIAAREPRQHPIADWVAHVGESTAEAARGALDLLSFFGLITITLAGIAVRPSRLRIRSVLVHIEQTGLNALPILGLLSFLIGVVLAFQGADQLRRFGAELFVVNLLGVSILREIGILMTAIIVAGRSGSAFTAQIGTMKVNQEVDAIRTLGLDPVELLVVPRVLALVLCLPLLAFYADILGLLGGALMSWLTLEIPPGVFVRQLQSAVSLNVFLVGMVKAPVFALVIAMVGCYEGLKVSGSAESVGRLTTKAVVESIFLVIILDAAFSILFSYLGV